MRDAPEGDLADPGGGQVKEAGCVEDWRGLLLPLARVQDALARLGAAAALASEAAREGLVGAWGVTPHAGRLAQEIAGHGGYGG